MTKEENKKIGKRVALARKMAGYKTKRKLADKLDGISEQVIKNIESGTTELKVDLAIQISDLCNVSLDYLYNLMEFKNAEDYSLDKMLDEMFDIEIFNKEYTDQHLQIHNIETLQIKTNSVYIKYLIDLLKLKEKKRNKEISYDDYNEYHEELEEELAENINKKNINTMDMYYILVPKMYYDASFNEEDIEKLGDIINRMIKDKCR